MCALSTRCVQALVKLEKNMQDYFKRTLCEEEVEPKDLAICEAPARFHDAKGTPVDKDIMGLINVS